MIEVLYFFMVAVFVSYVIYIAINYGVLPSISESYYRLPDNRKILFTLFAWSFAMSALIIGDSVLMFLAGSGIIFVGAASAMRRRLTRTVHLVGAITGITLAFFAIIFQYCMWYIAIVIVLCIALAYLIDKRHILWWIEVIIFIAISIVLGITIF